MKNLQKWRFRFVAWSLLLVAIMVGGLFDHWQTPIVVAAGESCTVKAGQGLNLREGPGSNYAVKKVLANGSKVTPVARIANGSYVRVKAVAVDGWVSASFVTCNITISKLPVQTPPPTPTKNNAPTPTATPFQVSYSDAPNQGGSPDGLDGNILIPSSALVRGSSQAVFRDFLMIQLDVRDPDAKSGNGIKNVTFRISDDNGNDIYSNEEGAAPYCLFKNDGSTCNVIWFFNQTNNRWPGNGGDFAKLGKSRIDPNVEYRAEIEASSTDGQKNGSWNFRFRIIPTGTPPQDVYVVPSMGFSRKNFDYDAEVRVQFDTVLDPNDGTVTFNQRMVFQLYVFDSNSGNEAADVGAVEFVIRDDDSGQVVYQHSERNKPFCVFGNVQNYCDNIWTFSDTSNRWPPSDADSGVPNNIKATANTSYTASMTVYDTDGNEIGDWDFFLEVK